MSEERVVEDRGRVWVSEGYVDRKKGKKVDAGGTMSGKYMEGERRRLENDGLIRGGAKWGAGD